MRVLLTSAIPPDLPPSHRYAHTLSIPLGLLYVATYLLAQKEGEGVEVVVTGDPRMTMEAGADLIGIYSVTQNFNYAVEIARQARAKGIVTVVGGPHVTAIPHRFPSEFDFGVVGEGEKTFLELVSGLKAGRRPGDPRWKTAPGLVSHGLDGQVFFAGRRPEEPDLDRFPFPRRERWCRRLGIAQMTTSRGCPFSCSYCSEPVLWDRYRVHSPATVVQEIEQILAHFPVPHILMADDIFPIRVERLREMAALFESSGISRRVAFSGWGRAQLLTEEMVVLLKRMNFIYLAFGMESASPGVLARIKKGATIESNQRALDLCHQAGLKVGCTFVIASPHETVEDLEATYRFIRHNRDKIAGIEINPAVPLPGTPLWADAMARGLVSEEMDWSRLRDYSVFEEFDVGRYVVVNEHFFEPAYQELFRRMHELYREVVDRGEIQELTLGYLNPTMEPASFLD